MSGVNANNTNPASFRGLTASDVSVSASALQKLTNDYAAAIKKNPALAGDADFMNRFNLSKQAVGVQKTAAIAGNALTLNDSLLLSQKALDDVQKAFVGKSTVAQTSAIGELTRQLGRTLKSGNQLQGEIGSAVFANNSLYAAANKGVSAAVNGVVPVTDIAGSMADLANAQLQATRDFSEMQKVLLDPKATLSAKIVASAKATGSASGFVTKQDAFLKSVESADQAYLEQSDTYRRLTDKTRNAKFVLMASTAKNNLMQHAMQAAEVGGLSAALVLSAVSLPSLVVSTKKNFDKLLTTVEDPNASLLQMGDALGDTARAGAGTVYAVQGINASFIGVTTALKKSEKFSSLMAKAEGSVIVNNPLVAFSKTTFGKILDFLLPIADLGIAMADFMKAYHTFHDPNAEWEQKARSTLDVGLDLIKVLTYMIPEARAMRYAYIGASFAQMGLATWDFAKVMKPTAQKVGAAFVEAASHPGQTIKAIGNAAQEGVMKVEKALSSTVDWVENLFEHPAETIENIEQSAAAFEYRLVDGSRKVFAKIQRTLNGEDPNQTVPSPA